MVQSAFHATSGGVDVIRVDDVGDNAAVLNHGAVSVGTTATLVAAANANRVSIVVQNLGTPAIHVGGSTVTAANGYKLISGDSTPPLKTRTAIYAIAESATSDVRRLEESLT